MLSAVNLRQIYFIIRGGEPEKVLTRLERPCLITEIDSIGGQMVSRARTKPQLCRITSPNWGSSGWAVRLCHRPSSSNLGEGVRKEHNMMDGALALAILPKIWSKIKGSNDKTEPRELSAKKIFWKHCDQRRHCQQVMTFHATPNLQLSVPSHLRLSKAAFVK